VEGAAATAAPTADAAGATGGGGGGSSSSWQPARLLEINTRFEPAAYRAHGEGPPLCPTPSLHAASAAPYRPGALQRIFRFYAPLATPAKVRGGRHALCFADHAACNASLSFAKLRAFAQDFAVVPALLSVRELEALWRGRRQHDCAAEARTMAARVAASQARDAGWQQRGLPSYDPAAPPPPAHPLVPPPPGALSYRGVVDVLCRAALLAFSKPGLAGRAAAAAAAAAADGGGGGGGSSSNSSSREEEEGPWTEQGAVLALIEHLGLRDARRVRRVLNSGAPRATAGILNAREPSCSWMQAGVNEAHVARRAARRQRCEAERRGREGGHGRRRHSTPAAASSASSSAKVKAAATMARQQAAAAAAVSAAGPAAISSSSSSSSTTSSSPSSLAALFEPFAVASSRPGARVWAEYAGPFVDAGTRLCGKQQQQQQQQQQASSSYLVLISNRSHAPVKLQLRLEEGGGGNGGDPGGGVRIVSGGGSVTVPPGLRHAVRLALDLRRAAPREGVGALAVSATQLLHCTAPEGLGTGGKKGAASPATARQAAPTRLVERVRVPIFCNGVLPGSFSAEGTARLPAGAAVLAATATRPGFLRPGASAAQPPLGWGAGVGGAPMLRRPASAGAAHSHRRRCSGGSGGDGGSTGGSSRRPLRAASASRSRSYSAEAMQQQQQQQQQQRRRRRRQQQGERGSSPSPNIAATTSFATVSVFEASVDGQWEPQEQSTARSTRPSPRSSSDSAAPSLHATIARSDGRTRMPASLARAPV
jgi:hypothetical protein